MRKIHQLPDHIIAKIAAGEVIERPAYAVKELIDNAIDANADEITIQIEEAGLKKITVIDNGEGMNEEDLPESIKPHTTSKLSIDDSFTGIRSLGFRGEALTSIAAMSHLVIKSRTIDTPAGTMILVKNGLVEKVEPAGMPVGTTVIIHNLFSSVPARRKFLKTDRTELRTILTIITQYALSYPHIRFSVSHNKRVLLHVPKQELFDRIRHLLGHDLSEKLLPVISTEGHIKIQGFLAHPQITSQSTQKQFLFINNRVLSDRVISLSVKESYGSLLEPNTHPVFLLFLTMPYEMVDVNVHPRKEQVSFINSHLVLEEIKKTVKETLEHHNLTFHNRNWRLPFSPRKAEMKSFVGQLLKDDVNPWQGQTGIIPEGDFIQLHSVYFVTQTKNGLLFIDQHAAHERILYEQYTEAFQKQKKQQLLHRLPKPIRITLSPADMLIFQEYLPLFEQIGFRVESVIHTTITMIQIPLLLKDYNLSKVMHEMLDDIAENEKINTLDRQTKKIITYLSCRTAIKAGEIVDQEHMKEMVAKLEQTNNNYTCPHGRPTKIEISLKDLHRMFKRI